MKQIPLTQEKVALVDDTDYEHFNQWNWHYTSEGYAARNASRKTPGGRKKIFMHREIMQTPDDMEVDHRDGNGLNNQRYNMRNCTHAKNMHNKPKPANNKSGYVGVSWSKSGGGWEAYITNDGEHIYLGLFDVAEDAAQARDAKARELRGEFANTNF